MTSPDGITASMWAAGDGSKQIPVAGLLAHDPSLHEAQLAPADWEQLLADYLLSPRI